MNPFTTICPRRVGPRSRPHCRFKNLAHAVWTKVQAYRTFQVFILSLAVASTTFADEVILDFEEGPLGEWIPTWEEKGVSFKLAWAPTQSKAKGSLTFFPHIGTGRRGILCAMADEPIPVEVGFEKPVSNISITFWAQTGSAALLEAFDAEGTLIDSASLDEAPRRKAPEEPMPQFEMQVSGSNIAYIRFSGPRSGEFLAADEIRFR